ncbi:hypothetical protein ACHAXA_005553 [Cyclostephanos tholiformis]|uniref:EF-hand domain-containing protein n=1 Tax=Cyclostephanos tholiformis TaxID=382380 RepID=A0ABD3RFP7_9STRA
MPDPYAPTNDDGDNFDSVLAPYKPFVSKLTISSLMGYFSAITAKRVGKSIAFVAGLGFIALQGMVYSGFVIVDWKKMEKSAVDALDTDDDGKITEQDVRTHLKKVMSSITYKIPDASGFGLGFMFGLKH